MANLTHNYSPHMKPNVESASPTKGLRTSLTTTARDCLRIYLEKWRIDRRNGKTGTSGDSRKVDMVSSICIFHILTKTYMNIDGHILWIRSSILLSFNY